MYKHCPIVVAVIGLVTLLIGIICTWYGFPKLVEWQISKSIAMEEGTQAYDVWRKQPFPLKFKVYLFNVTNPGEVMVGGSPVLKEVGPYIYDLYYERTVIEVDEKSDTIKYNLKKLYYFNDKDSGCRSDTDIVTVINAALMGTVLQITTLLPNALSMVTQAVPYIWPEAKDMFMTVNVRELLFGGITLHCSAEEISTMCQGMRMVLPATITVAENDKDYVFSMFGAFNGTTFGPFIMGRGLENTTRGEIYTYMDEALLDVWDKDRCNMLNGSDSGLYVPMKKPAKKIYVFTPDICRSVGVSFVRKTLLYDIPVYKYENDEESFSHKGADSCFCDEIDDNEYECPPEGLVNLYNCLKAPVLMSNPHFYLADKALLEYASGVMPQKDLHGSYMMIEPRTATPLQGAKRIQMNIEVKRFEEFPYLQNISEGIFPILWIEEGVILPDNLLKFLIGSFQKIAMLDIIKWIFILLGLALVTLSFVLVMYQEKLMCFASSGKITVNNASEFNNFNTNAPNLNFNTSVIYPQGQNGGNDSIGKRNPHVTVPEAWQFNL